MEQRWPQNPRPSGRRDSVKVRSLDQFYQYVEKNSDRVVTSAERSADVGTTPPAMRPALPAVRYVMRNGVTIAVPLDEPAVSPRTIEVADQPAWSRDTEDAEHWRSLPHTIQLLARLAREESIGADGGGDGERRQLLERLLNPMLSLDDTARLLGVCAATVRRWANKGTLPYQRTVGGQRRFHLGDVLAALEQRDRQDADAAAPALSHP